MLRWDYVDDTTVLGMTVKMYRDPFVEGSYFISPEKGLEMDHYAFKYFQSELYMYKILDVNFEQYIEERGDTRRLTSIKIASDEDTTETIL